MKQASYWRQLRLSGDHLKCTLFVLLLLLFDGGTSPTKKDSSSQEDRIPVRPSTVTTKYGSLRGVVVNLSGRHLQPVEMFLGVPYAGIPKKSLRFLPPVTPPQWKGVKTFDKFGPVCPQKLPDINNDTDALNAMPTGRLDYLRRLVPHLHNQSEDCLYLNIYAPAGTPRNGKSMIPVLVFIHGESYSWNAGSPYDGSVLSSAGNIIVITLNYRLGIFGFLPPLDTTQRGNYGIMDQVAALHWIQENIGEFGGDPKKVTVMGHGHGAACVNILMLSPLARGLFQRAILHSGSALSPWAIARDPMAYTHKVAHALECPTEDNAVLVQCLREKSIQEILSVQLGVPDHLTAFGPTIDGVVIPGEPMSLMEHQSDYFPRYDLLLGVTKTESYFHFSSQEDKTGIDAARRDRLLRTLVRNLFMFHLQEIFLTVVNEYTDWNKPDQHPINILDSTTDAMGDALIVAPLIRTANFHSRMKSPKNQKTYLYVFSHQTEVSSFSNRLGCLHAEELPYVFGSPLVSQLTPFPNNFSKAETTLSDTVMSYWSNFVKYGDPNFSGGNAPASTTTTEKSKGSKHEKIIWSDYDDSQQKYLLVGLKPKIKDHYEAHRLSFWLHLIPTLHRSASSEIGARHHLLEDHDNPYTYDGIIRREQPLTDAARPHTSSTPVNATTPDLIGNVSEPVVTYTSSEPTTAHKSTDTSDSKIFNFSDTLAMIFQQGAYSTALTVTIGVGCSLLMLNIIIFAGVYCHRERTLPRQLNDYKDTS